MKLAFYHGTRPGWRARLISRVIKWHSRSKYSHVEIIFSDGWRAGSTSADNGVRFTREPCNPAEWDIVDVEGDEDFARAWFFAHEGAQFDDAGVWAFLIGGDHDLDRWFCSEAVAAALQFPESHIHNPATLYSYVRRGRKA
jgi:hypothetical protein